MRLTQLRRRLGPAVLAAVLLTGLGAGTAAAAPALPLIPGPGTSNAVFYQQPDADALEAMAPGDVIRSRTIAVHLAGLPLPVEATQLFYRTTSETGQPQATATTVLKPVLPSLGGVKLLSYQSFYDSLTTACQPSTVMAGGLDKGAISTVETLLLVTALKQGYTVLSSDFEGQDPAFGAGRQYGRGTLDGIRAAEKAGVYGLGTDTPVGMMGYSGGAIATEWATELAPDYAPEVNAHLVGSAMGGVLVNPLRNLRYADGSPIWSGVIPMAAVGISRAFDIDIAKYTNPEGQRIVEKTEDACIADALGRYPGKRFADFTQPQYPTPESIPEVRDAVNELIMSTGGTPTVPLMVRQGDGGATEGADQNKPGIGPGDGIMIAGDVRSLVREYCGKGVSVDYREYTGISHTPGGGLFLPEAFGWLAQRFGGAPAVDDCAGVAPGNPDALAPA